MEVHIEEKCIIYIETMSFKSCRKIGMKNTQICNSRILTRNIKLTYRAKGKHCPGKNGYRMIHSET